MADELWRMSAVEAVARLRKREISPLDLVEASAQRIGEVEPAVNALPTLCLDRARDHAQRIMQGGAACEAAGEAGWLAGLPVSIKDLTDVAGVRTTYGSPLFADHVPSKSHPLVERIERKGGIVMGKSNTPEFGAGGSTFNEVFGRTMPGAGSERREGRRLPGFRAGCLLDQPLRTGNQADAASGQGRARLCARDRLRVSGSAGHLPVRRVEADRPRAEARSSARRRGGVGRPVAAFLSRCYGAEGRRARTSWQTTH